MDSSAAVTGTSADSNELTPAQLLMAKHAEALAHQPTIEDVVDEEDLAHPTASSETSAAPTTNGASMSAKAVGKQKEAPSAPAAKPKPALDTQSEEAFPSLGASKAPSSATASAWSNKPSSVRNGQPSGAAYQANGASPGNNATPRSYAPNGRGNIMAIPGRSIQEMHIQSSQLKTSAELRKSLPELLREINKRSKANVTMRSAAGGVIVFTGQGPSDDSVREVLKEVVSRVGAKQTVKVSIPSSVRPHIIGKQGSTIQSIEKSTGARVRVPNVENAADDEDDTMIDVLIEGDPHAAEMARREVERIVGQRTINVSLKLKDIPAELYPFIAGAHNARSNALEQSHDVRVKVPSYHTWQSQAPPQAPQRGQTVQFRPNSGIPIQISGEREAARNAQAEIERQVQELQRALTLSQFDIERERHQFIVGDKGTSLHDFLEDTGCSIILPPPGEDSEVITVIGPPDQIEAAVSKAMDLAASMSMASVDVARLHPSGAHEHARDVARYLDQRRALQKFEDSYGAQVVLPSGSDGSSPWQIYSRDGKTTMRARSDLMNLVHGHPPSRFRNVNIEPFYQRELQQQHAQSIRDQFGVHSVFSAEAEESPRVLLVYEGSAPSEGYEFPQAKPSNDEVQQFEKALQEVEQYLQGLVDGQEQVVSRSIDAPSKYREKIQKYVAREGEREPRPQYPVQFPGLVGQHKGNAGANFPVDFRGPTSAVEEYAEKLAAFIEEQIRDEAERGYTITFDFPQKFANFLIGKKGENINKLREEFDVEIQVNEGKVEIKGPKAKADAAKAHILSLGRKLEDQMTHVLKIKPQFHRDLIGAKGSLVLRLQDRYGVRINFPRTSKADGSDDDASDAGKARGPSQAADEIIIKGPKKGADEARDEIFSLYQYAQDNSNSASVSVAQSQLPSLIGQAGRELDNLRLTTGAQIDIPGSKDVVDPSGRVEIKIKGTKAQVESAKKELEARARTFDDTVTRTLNIDKKHHRTLIGREGDNIKRMVAAAGGPDDGRERARMVQFPKADSSESSIRVEGPKELVDKICASIQSFVDQRESQVTESIEVPPARHGKLIGRGGETRKALESEFNIILAVPNTSTTGAARSIIKITGMPSEVAKAKERIASMTQEQPGETIIIPVRLHHAVADSSNGNLFRNLSRNLKVTVDHAGRQRPARPEASTRPAAASSNLPLITDDAADTSSQNAETNHSFDIVDATIGAGADGEETIPWVLKGADAANITKARQMIEAAMSAAQNSVTGYLRLPDPKTYRYVIGAGGATVNGIRKQTGCDITVPPSGSRDDAIKLRGTKEAILQAKDLVIEAVMNATSSR